MNVVIIEDEIQAAWDLQDSIKRHRPDFTVCAMIDSVESGLEWFAENKMPDLIFSDIQLGDGVAFDIFKKVKMECPVIFCTAYDEYGIQAFQNNGIDYLLKPVKDDALEKSLAKIEILKRSGTQKHEPDLITRLLKEVGADGKFYKSTFLVSFREKMIPVHVDDITFFSVAGEIVHLHTKGNKVYVLHYSLDYVESMLDPKAFYRANRQFLVAYHAVKEIQHYFDRKLLIELTHPTTEPVVVSKAKASAFIKWMEEH